MNTNTNALGDVVPTVCPVCTGPCTLPGDGPTGQLGGLCTVCGWDYLLDGGDGQADAPAVEPDAPTPDAEGVEADARPVVEGDALLDAARAYVARWRTVSRFTGAEPVGEAGAVRVWYVGPSAARARDGQPIEAEFCEVVGACGVEAVTRCAGCGHDVDEHLNGRAECVVCDCGGVEVEPDRAELLRLTRNRLLAELVAVDVARVGLSVEQAAERARIAPETLARRLAGETFTMAELGGLADVCGVRASTWITSVDNTLADARKVQA